MPKPAPRIPKDLPEWGSTKEEQKAERYAPKHLENIRQLPCAATLTGPRSDPHHLMRGEGVARGTGLSAQDRWAIPLCRRVHDEITKTGNPEAVLMDRYGLDARALAEALWRNRGDLPAMRRAVERAYQDARLRQAAA